MAEQDTSTVVIAAGGTGGHIYPGLAVAEALLETEPGTRVEFLGTAHGLETTIVPAAGHRLHLVPMSPVAGRSVAWLPWQLGRAVAVARRQLRALGADAVLTMGGYAGVAPALAARSLGLPVVVHESGAIPGRANLLAARLTPHVAVAFDSAAAAIGKPVRVTGMPMAAAIATMDRAALRPVARAVMGIPEDAFTVLVLGGSRGAARLNDAGVGLARRWRNRTGLRLVLHTGTGRAAAVTAELSALGADTTAIAVGHLERMEHAYAAADLVVCRAGAGTVAELAAAGLPAVLVPYPHATDDHQARNAAAVAGAGAAVVLPDAEATAERIEQVITELRADPAALADMAAAAARRAEPHAAHRLACWVLDAIDEHRRAGEWTR